MPYTLSIYSSPVSNPYLAWVSILCFVGEEVGEGALNRTVRFAKETACAVWRCS